MGKARPKSKGGCRPAKQSPYQRAPRAPRSERRGRFLPEGADFAASGLAPARGDTGRGLPVRWVRPVLFWEKFQILEGVFHEMESLRPWDAPPSGVLRPPSRGGKGCFCQGRASVARRPLCGERPVEAPPHRGHLTDNPKGECLFATLSPGREHPAQAASDVEGADEAPPASGRGTFSTCGKG